MTHIIKINQESPEPEKIDEAVAILHRGGVIAFPTETFYGLGADARNEAAVGKIFDIKGRDFSNPILVVIGDPEHLDAFVRDVPAGARRLMSRLWPGPLTIVFRASAPVSPMLTAGTAKIGVRLTSHPVARELARRLGGPLTATSANRSGAPECSSAADVLSQLGGGIDAVVDGGPTPGGKGSTIVDATVFPVRVLREGVIPSSLIQDTLSTT
ncbi:MAG TPA: L-threonylcarbamoyladenylate synthase [Syntrophales bacterium]|nr:L-threonylcarbamoyladenylate synthase [Syntrophales bacterium]HNS54354.1 L-threonylcarbamoyladenylate synthase [Syntrophales bacterium]HQL89540.1 L-threonylcarbamoyladenylate synthase [Syntrophales bacterium]